MMEKKKSIDDSGDGPWYRYVRRYDRENLVTILVICAGMTFAVHSMGGAHYRLSAIALYVFMVVVTYGFQSMISMAVRQYRKDVEELDSQIQTMGLDHPYVSYQSRSLGIGGFVIGIGLLFLRPLSITSLVPLLYESTPRRAILSFLVSVVGNLVWAFANHAFLNPVRDGEDDMPPFLRTFRHYPPTGSHNIHDQNHRRLHEGRARADHQGGRQQTRQVGSWR